MPSKQKIIVAIEIVFDQRALDAYIEICWWLVVEPYNSFSEERKPIAEIWVDEKSFFPQHEGNFFIFVLGDLIEESANLCILPARRKWERNQQQGRSEE